jgi:hypothetical protein
MNQPLAAAPPPSPNPASHSPAAKRMRRHRERRRHGYRCVTIELCETEIDALVARRLLKHETRNNEGAILDALYALLDRTLGGPAG